MDNNFMNFGSGSELLGGANAAINAAIQRRQGGTGGAMEQVSPMAPSASPQMTSTPPTASARALPQVPSAQAMPQTPSAQTVPSQGAGLPVGNPEAETILKALTQRLSTISKLETGGM